MKFRPVVLVASLLLVAAVPAQAELLHKKVSKQLTITSPSLDIVACCPAGRIAESGGYSFIGSTVADPVTTVASIPYAELAGANAPRGWRVDLLRASVEHNATVDVDVFLVCRAPTAGEDASGDCHEQP